MSGDFNFIELVTGCASNRGRVVEMPKERMPDYHGKAAPTDAYASVYRFSAELADYAKRTGSIRGYGGPCRAIGLHFDFDGAEALSDLRIFIESICNDRLGIFIDMIRIWFSGNKGFHICIIHPEIDAMPAASDMPDKIKRLATALAGRFATFDRAVYDKTRIFRVPNSKHGKSGLFKVPLLAGEIFTLDMAAIRALAVQQRSIADACRQWMKALKDGRKWD